MPVVLQFVFFLVAFICFALEAFRTRSLVSLGLACWVFVSVWSTADRL